jgi:RNA polymerase sigma-70 factor, ECF subfamily
MLACRIEEAAMVLVSDIGEAYRCHIAMVRGRALRILGVEATAQDVAQEAFVKLLEYRRRGPLEDNTSAFLYRVATNLALNRLRDSKRRQELLLAQSQTGSTVDEPIDRVALRKVLGLVGKDEAEIAIYYYVDGMEQEEIAELLHMERRTVGRRLERFCVRARKLLDLGKETHVDA